MIYRHLLRPLLFQIDPERVHHLAFNGLRLAFSIPGTAAIARGLYPQKGTGLEKEVFGVKFDNPVGLAAGFDKDGLLGDSWSNLGFGFVEFGTVTPRPQPGNPRKRLFRLPSDQAIINRMGFNNEGVEALARRLSKMDREKMVIGANIGKNKDTPNDSATDDYLICLRRLREMVDYFAVNVSSPNTPGLRSLQEKGPLTDLLKKLQEANHQEGTPRPILLKIAPDLQDADLDDIVDVARETELAGLIATNTTISREGLKTPPMRVESMGAGGLSGAPLRSRSLEVLRYLRQKTELPIISVGGIMSAEDAWERLEAGANLVQLYSGFVYEGPALVRGILGKIQRQRGQ